MWTLVGMAWGATAGVVPITAAIAVLVSSLQAAGGGFIALKCCWLGITWRRGTEHGMDEFSAIGISAALIVGASIIGAAVTGVNGMPLAPQMLVLGSGSDLLGEVVGSVLYLWGALGPGVWLKRRVWR